MLVSAVFVSEDISSIATSLLAHGGPSSAEPAPAARGRKLCGMSGCHVTPILRTQEPHCRRGCIDTYRPQPRWVKSSFNKDNIQISQCTILVMPQGVGRLGVERLCQSISEWSEQRVFVLLPPRDV